MRLNYEVKDNTATKRDLADLANKYGLLSVVRWKPKQVGFFFPPYPKRGLVLGQLVLISTFAVTGGKRERVRLGAGACAGAVCDYWSGVVGAWGRGCEQCCQGEDIGAHGSNHAVIDWSEAALVVLCGFSVL